MPERETTLRFQVPQWTPETEADKKREQYAIKLMDLRKNIEDEMMPFLDE